MACTAKDTRKTFKCLAGVLLVGAVLSVFGLLAAGCNAHAAPPPFERPYLTWQGDPCTTMTINFQTPTVPGRVEVHYDTAARAGRADAYAAKAEGISRKVKGLADGRSINSVELTGLKPGTRYFFVFENEKGGHSSEYQFETIADDGRAIRFVNGGDLGEEPVVTDLCRFAAAENPAFAVIGGDLAYENGELAEYATADEWLDIWTSTMVAKDGRIIPLVAPIGNHEVNDGNGSPEERAPFYFGYYPQGGKSYFVRDFGPNLRFIALDSGHIVDHASQSDWLREQLQSAGGRHTVAGYHVPLFPSHREFTAGGSDAGRRSWMPLFDKFHLSLGLEHHDHAFKRTKALLGGEPDAKGTVYVGDGCMGREPREVDTSRYYIEKGGATRHFWVLDVASDKINCRAIDESGKVFDEFSVN